jgi:hypothetical protein
MKATKELKNMFELDNEFCQSIVMNRYENVLTRLQIRDMGYSVLPLWVFVMFEFGKHHKGVWEEYDWKKECEIK